MDRPKEHDGSTKCVEEGGVRTVLFSAFDHNGILACARRTRFPDAERPRGLRSIPVGEPPGQRKASIAPN